MVGEVTVRTDFNFGGSNARAFPFSVFIMGESHSLSCYWKSVPFFADHFIRNTEIDHAGTSNG